MITKVCSKCGVEKPLDGYVRDRNKRDGRRSECKECCRKTRGSVRRNRKRDPTSTTLECLRCHQVKSRAEFSTNLLPNGTRYYFSICRVCNCAQQRDQTYRLKTGEYGAMLLEQGGVCKLCSKTPEQNKEALAVDHDHKTGRIRGLLCRSCNYGLGRFCDDTNILTRAILYLRGEL